MSELPTQYDILRTIREELITLNNQISNLLGSISVLSICSSVSMSSDLVALALIAPETAQQLKEQATAALLEIRDRSL